MTGTEPDLSETPAAPPTKPRPALLLAGGQILHQLILLVRNPLGFFITLVVPLLLLACLSLLTPDTVTAMPPGVHYSQFLTPAMATFSLLNACYVNNVTGIVLAREQGILRRLRGTPLPGWCYLAGRFGASMVSAALTLAIVFAIGVGLLHATWRWDATGRLLAVSVLAVCCFVLLGTAVSTIVPSTATGLPIAYGTMLPLAFISDVFFSSAHAPHWLHTVASVFPVAPIARGMEDAFSATGGAWPIPLTGMLCLGAWSAGAAATAVFAFRWEPAGAHHHRFGAIGRATSELRDATRRLLGKLRATVRLRQRVT